MKRFLVLTVLFCSLSPAFAGDGVEQLYTPVERVYSVQEAQNLSLFGYLADLGMSKEEMSAPGAFVETYRDNVLTVFGYKHMFKNTIYVPPALRQDIAPGTIVVSNKGERHKVANAVLPRSHEAAYACIDHSGLAGLSSCIKDVETPAKE